jgi:NADH-quinone oxidoreductase subunit L
MEIYLALIPIFPLLGFLILSLTGFRLSQKANAIVGAGSVGISALLTIIQGIAFLSSPTEDGAISVRLWEWMNAGGFSAEISLKMDALSLIFCFVITFVGFLIHIYSIEFMKNDDGFARFFAYMNLFVSSMLILVLADNLVLLYLGWEGVGLCSYLLIGFWYKEPANGDAARKAFIITRIGDTAMLLGLFLLFISFGTLNIDQLMTQAPLIWEKGSMMPVLAAALLLGGALGKSAQLPLQTWLPDAMAGPSPVSALIHAATMVTAGVYLIARSHVLFMLAPVVQTAVAIIGALTLLIAGFSALAQHDLKRILAYSTISQIGYMFLALGIGAWSAGIFHFMIHAFFKALLFLAAGAVIAVLDEEHDIIKMGGLRRKLPAIFITFLIGSASLSALPLITAGFYSKDQILWFAWSSENGSLWLWLAGIVGAFLTSLYTFRMVFITFFGETGTEPTHKPGKFMMIPITILAVLSILGGFIELPESWAHLQLFSHSLNKVFPTISLSHKGIPEIFFQILSAVVAMSGIYIAWLIYLKKLKPAESPSFDRIGHFFYKGWGFDKLYDFVIVKPVVWFSEIDKKDFIDSFFTGITSVTFMFNRILSLLQNGKLRWYVTAVAIGIAFILTVMINL